MKKCLSSIRTSVVDLIGNMLKHWRRTQDLSIKNILLRRLQCLRAVAINLGALNTTKVPLSHPVYKLFSETVCSLSRVWRATAYALKRRQASLWDYDTLWRRLGHCQWYTYMLNCLLVQFSKIVIVEKNVYCDWTYIFLLCQIDRWYIVSWTFELFRMIFGTLSY